MISIIIPVYNQPRQLKRCLESIKAQTYDNYEIILVNDRSTRQMGSVVAPMKREFSLRLTILNNQANHGAPYSRNKGLKKAKGEFVIFCDADVTMKPDMLAKMHAALAAHPEAAYAYSGHRFGWKTFRSFPFDAERLKLMPYIHSTSLVRRERLPHPCWDESLRRLQDWDLWLTMLEQGNAGVWIDETLFDVEGGGTMSRWLPKSFYTLFPFLPSVMRYKDAILAIREKHRL